MRASLKDFKVQEQYRVFVGEKLHNFWTEKQTKDGQENILILFRKLREGIFASKRSDAFAIEDIFYSPSYLLPELYTSASIQPPISSVLISLLHHLIRDTIAKSLLRTSFVPLAHVLDRTSEAHAWISNLATSLRTLNHIRFEALSRHDVYRHLLPVSKASDETHHALDRLSQDAVHALVERLRSKARDKVWVVLRKTQTWMAKCLLLSTEQASTSGLSLEEWIDGRCRDGHLRPKEGAVGKWIVCKVR
ncbi:hypothetical protein EDB19DRAFT_1743850 [Suillus lakei]|nr:hypothetical protein EDB19DRAFT_1743850 [Suillus lakei]